MMQKVGIQFQKPIAKLLIHNRFQIAHILQCQIPQYVTMHRFNDCIVTFLPIRRIKLPIDPNESF
jgi:hypothetical protein